MHTTSINCSSASATRTVAWLLSTPPERLVCIKTTHLSSGFMKIYRHRLAISTSWMCTWKCPRSCRSKFSKSLKSNHCWSPCIQIELRLDTCINNQDEVITPGFLCHSNGHSTMQWPCSTSAGMSPEGKLMRKVFKNE